MKGARLRERRRWVARLLAGGRPSWTVAFTCTGCHTKRPWADNGVAPRTVCTTSVREAQTYDHQDRPGTAHHAARRHGDPPARLRRLPGAARGHRRGGHPRVRGGLPPHRHRGRLPERGGGRPGVPRVRPRPRGRLHHDEVLQHRPRPRGGPARVQAEPGAARPRPRRPLPHPLAGPVAGPLRRDVEGVHRAAVRGPRPCDRRLELPARPPPPDRRRDGRDPGRQPGRAPPAPPAGRTAARARRPRHRHGGMEPARPGRGARRPHDHRDRRRARQDAVPGRHPLAPAARQRRDPEVP